MYVLRREDEMPFPRAIFESLFYLRDELGSEQADALLLRNVLTHETVEVLVRNT